MSAAHPDRRAVLAGAGVVAAVAVRGEAQVLPGAAPAAPWTRQGLVKRAGGSIHYVCLGEGEPVILLHKLGGWVDDWRQFAPLIAQGRRIIAIDMPGHGGSAMLGSPPYVQTLAENAAMIKAVLEELDIPRAAFVGSSLGGCTAIIMAAFWPQMVSRLVLISVSLSAARPRSSLAENDAAAKSAFDATGLPLPRTAAQTQQFGSIDPRVNEEQNASRAKAGLWIRPCERGVALGGMEEHLSAIQAPTLLIYADRGIYARHEAVGRAKIRTVTVATIPEVGSFTYQEKPHETAAIVNPFLDKSSVG